MISYFLRMESTFANLSITNEKEVEILLEDGNDIEGQVTSEHCLVGRFITQQTINFNSMRNTLASVWKPVRGVSIKAIGEGRFLFQFFHVLDVKRILEGSPWSFNNHPLVLHSLLKGDHPHRVPLNKVPYWVQIYDLPHGFITEKVGVQLGNFVGKFLEYDNSNHGASWMTYMRIRVEVDTKIPLKRWKKVGHNRVLTSWFILRMVAKIAKIGSLGARRLTSA
ncbi:hypothetical protein ACS0TY_024880 [Phlomoides rotata]